MSKNVQQIRLRVDIEIDKEKEKDIDAVEGVVGGTER